MGFLRRNLSAPLPGPLAYVPALIALLGCAIALRATPRRSLGLLAFFVCASLGAVLYFNLPQHYFRTLDRHYLPSLVVLTPFVAVGAAALLRLGARARGMAKPALGLGLAGLLLVAPIRLWMANRRACDLARVRYAETFGRGLLEPLEKDSILVTNGDNDTFPLWYLPGGGGRPPGRHERQPPDCRHGMVDPGAAPARSALRAAAGRAGGRGSWRRRSPGTAR